MITRNLPTLKSTKMRNERTKKARKRSYGRKKIRIRIRNRIKSFCYFLFHFSILQILGRFNKNVLYSQIIKLHGSKNSKIAESITNVRFIPPSSPSLKSVTSKFNILSYHLLFSSFFGRDLVSVFSLWPVEEKAG